MENNQEPTVAALIDRYQAETLPTLAPRTQKDYVRHLAKLKEIFGHFHPDEMRPRDFGPFLHNEGKARGRIQKVRQLAVLSSVFTQAVSFWFSMERNVLRDVKRPKQYPRDRLIENHEFEGCKALASPRVKLAMRLALKIGQRQGDILNLRWEDIKDMELHIYQTKTRKRLAIAVDSELETILDECWKLNNGGNAGSPWVLPTRRGVRYTSEGFRACWQRTMKKWMRRGGENFHYHDLRALCATRCPTPEYAMRLLGHTTLGMTMRVYRRGTERVQPLPPQI